MNAAWLNHYFTWLTESAKPARMIARANVKPLPYVGRHPYKPTDFSYPVYQLTNATVQLRDAFLDYLVKAEHGTRLPDSPGGHASVTIGNAKVNLMQQNDYLDLWMEKGKETGLVYEIGDRFDAVLATGAYDKFFLP